MSLPLALKTLIKNLGVDPIRTRWNTKYEKIRRDEIGEEMQAVKCPICEGRGFSVVVEREPPMQPCHGCSGKGWVEVGDSKTTYIWSPPNITLGSNSLPCGYSTSTGDFNKPE